MTNDYSARWFSTFLDTIPEERTAREIAFLRRHLPPDRYRRILDLACGPGRHAHALAEAGYAVTGVDIDRRSLEAARRRAGPGVDFIEADMRRLDDVGGRYDAVVCLWQSFGHFDTTTNRDVLRAVRDRLRPGGRFVLDIYNRRFFEPRQGVRSNERDGVEVEERKELRDGRLFVRLRYADSGAVDRFEWEVYSPEEIVAVASEQGLEPVLRCREFDETLDVSDDHPRMQLIFTRAS